MPSELSIFVSSRLQELGAERKLLFDLIPQLAEDDFTLKAWTYEQSPTSTDETVREKYLKAVDESHLYIGLFAKALGEWAVEEFERAGKSGIPRHIYVKNVASDQRAPQFKAFLSKLESATDSIVFQEYDSLDDLERKATTLLNSWLRDQITSRSIKDLQQTLQAARKNQDRSAEAIALGSLGNIYHGQGQYREAIEYYQQSLAISREIGDQHLEEVRLADLGEIDFSTGQYPQAIQYFQQALETCRANGNTQNEGKHLGRLGAATFSFGQYKEAFAHYSQAVNADRKSGNRSRVGSHLIALGLVHHVLGQYQWAIDHHQQGLVIKRELGEQHEVGNALRNIAAAHYNADQYDQAITYFQQALTVFRELGDRQSEGEMLGNIGTAYADLGKDDKAISFYRQARDIFVEVGVPDLIEWMDKAIEQAQPKEQPSGILHWLRGLFKR